MTDQQELTMAISDHYDQVSFFYKTCWGEHIHHGYWEDGEEPSAAQENLIARLARGAEVPRSARVLDVGCGLGGSSLWLAGRLACNVLSITLSPVQAQVASERAFEAGLDAQVSFRVMDANQLDLPDDSFDVVWIIECSEHLFDKPRFFANCARVLRPGGRLALCAWLAADDPTAAQAAEVAEVCRGMLCPSLGSRREHLHWLAAAGFRDVTADDLTRRVERTWEHCQAVIERPEIQALIAYMDERTRDFLSVFGTMRRAYADGAMAYGMFTARKA
jgi:tocopherol O-methyltransferase